MTLTREWRVALAIALAIVAAGALFFGGNQRQTYAHRDPNFSSPPRPREIICFIYDQLNHVGKPLPVFNADDCQNPPGVPPQCSDGIDNDGDGFIDEDDPGCSSDSDNNEFNEPAPQCSDGIDNDGDGKIDLSDPGCSGGTDNDETDPSSGGGGGDGSGSGGGGNNSGDSSPSTGSGSSGGGGSGGGGGIISGPLSVGFQDGSVGGVVLGTQTPPPACEMYLTDFLHIGRENNPEQVKKLQQFLNERMQANLPVTGFFGSLTFAAVEKFQLKYVPEILDPWGIDSNPTGYVYLTTRKKINELHCNNMRTFPLTPEEEKIIERARVSLQTTPTAQTITPSAPVASAPKFSPALTPTLPTLSIPALDIRGITEPSPPKVTREAIGTTTREQATTTPRRSILESIGEFFRGLFRR